MNDRNLVDSIGQGSIVLSFVEAVDFDAKRRLADSVLVSQIAFRGWSREEELCVELARRCYGSCWRMLRPSWQLYEELADRLPVIVEMARSSWDQEKQ